MKANLVVPGDRSGAADAVPAAALPAVSRTLLAALAALLAWRVLALLLNRTDLFFDEAQYWSWGLEPAFGYYSKPPLIAWIIGAATKLCGHGEACIRLPSPVIHTVTAFLVYQIGRRLYSETVGWWAGLGFATLPGISFSSGIISTDVPLLACWALALLAFVELMRRPSWGWSIVLGLAIGLGLNAKYAMIYFLPCVLLFLAVAPEKRGLLRDARLWAGVGLGLLLIVPNLAWNAANSFATFSHTADNANWGRKLLNPGKGAKFILAQFGVFGPVLFATLLVLAWRLRKGFAAFPVADRLLLSLSLPIIAAITVQAFLSRAHANWAATAYVAATVLVTAVLVRDGAGRWLRLSLAAHLVVIAVLALATWQAGRFTLPGGIDPFARTLGYREIAAVTREALTQARSAGRPYNAILTDDRELTAELLYYLRDAPIPVLAWRAGQRPRDHYELTRPYTSRSGEPVLLVSLKKEAGAVTKAFSRVEPVGTRATPAGLGRPRTVSLYALSGLQGR